MPGTTRYSATFDRTYEEEAKASSPPNARRSRSQSWQANSGHDGRQYTPFASRSPAPRSSSTENNSSNGTEFIPTRTAKTSVKAHNNPFQFVKVGTCPLYKKAEEQLKKAKETKKPDVLKEEEEEWQTNLDSWKSRRRKMSEDVFRRQEELKLLELEEQIAQVSNKKTKTFSEMVESRATRGRALSLCLLTSPLEFQNWEFENKAHKSGSCSFTDESGENSIVNSEDEGVSVRGRHEENSINENAMNHRTNGDAHIEQNGTALDKQNGNCNKLSNNVQLKTKENSYIDSGLESISSSHRAGDTPDSGSDFSQDSNSSIDCDSPRTGVNVLEEFSSKSSQISEGHEIRIILKLDEKGQDFGFTFLGGKDEGQVIIASILEGSKAESSGIHLGDRIIMIDGCDVNSKKHIEIAALIQKGREKNQMSLLLWRHTKTTNGTNGFIAEAKHNKVITDENFNAKSYEKSIESENEMFVDDFEDLKRQSELLANKKSVAANAQANGNKHSNKDAISLKTSSESSTAPIPKINTSNSAVEEPNKNEEKTEINSENQKKNIIKVKRVRRKGVYALNVDSNQISQDGNSTNTLFPLSPVTELPSPADETKTMSSTLSSNITLPVSSNITLPVSNSQNGFSDEGKQKNAENIKSNIPVSKENNSVIPTSANTEDSKSATLQTDSKNVENKIQLSTENEIEIANSPTLSSKNKDSQDEKSKSQPTPKKIKASKLKKGMALENTSAASECTNELTSVTQCKDVTSETVIQEKSSSESKSSHLENKQLSIKNDVKNLTALESMESNISSKNTPVKPATEIISVPTKTPSSAVSNGIGIQSPKVVANSINAPTTSIPPKLSTSEDSKPKKNIQKKVIAKSKGMALENTSAASECTNELTSVTQCEDVTSETVIQEKSSSESKSSHLENKQLSIKNDVKNLTALESMESNISSKNIPVKPATETISVPTKTPSSAVSNGIGIQSPKVVANSIKAPTTSIPPKLSTSEDSKPKKNIQKKVIAKSKGMALENTSAASECTNELTSVTQCEDVTSGTVIQEKSSSESKSSHLENKQLSIKNDVKNLTALESMESNISSKNIPVKPATETISVPTKTPSSAVSNGIGIQSPKVVANSIKAPTTSIPPKLLTSEDSKPKKNIQKKVIAKSKDNITEKTSYGTSTNSTLNEIYSTKEQSSSIVEKQEKVDSKNETAVYPLKEESNISLNGIANVPQETKQSPKDETSIPCPSINKVRDLTLKFGVKKPSMSSESSIPSKNAKALKSPVSEKTKPGFVEKKESTKAKENCVEQNIIGSPDALSSVSNSFDSSSKNTSLSNKDKQIKIAVKDEIIVASSKMGNSDVQAPIGNKQVTTKSSMSSVSNASDLQSSKNAVKEIQLKKEKKSTPLSQDEQIKTMVKNDIKVSPLTREKGMLSLDIGVNDATAVDKQSHKLPSPVVPANNPTSIVTPVNKSESDIVSPEISVTKNSIPKSPVNSPDEKPKLPIPKRSRNRSKKKSANSQKVNTPAKLNEESKISNDSLNVVFQSQPKNMGSENITNNKNFENNNNRTAISTDLVTDVPPVDKIAEEMEKLILEQLEEEERAKELSTGKVLVESSPEHLLTAPPRLAEPPKEKPPPPPSTESPKDSSLKRVNSTKRIKKEIYKRRSNFLGIENADESIICSESSVPPPPALEEILKAEMELDRQTRLRIENEATERLTLEEKEIMQKEREIIESLESEERRKMYMNGTEGCNNVYMSNSTSDAVCEQGHIESLKCERKRIDTELQLSEEQQQILIEEKQLKEREEFIRQQEAAISTASLSDSSLSVSANTANNLKKPALSSVPTEVQSNGLLLGTNGDGSGLALSSSTEVSMNETSKGGKKIKASEKPAVPPKPLKKKEAIRKERERLRQEQEALQREREEHRRKLMLEQEELMKKQKNHAPDAPASRLGPHPPQIQPSFPPQLTTTMNATPNARENASFPSRSHHGTSNTAAGSLNAVELMGPPVVRQNIRPAPRKAAQNEAWGQQKMPSVRKQNHESLPESRYNQNHWLIQEAEMRRIAELKERQRTTQTPCTQTHLAEDDVCSNPPRVPVISPTHNPHLNYPVQEKVWNYGQSNMPLKKYPPPVVKEPPLHTIYPRETVPQQPPTKPSRVVPSERQEQMLSVSGRKRCSHCNEELGRGAAMIIESLQLYYHIHCFQCCVCQAQLGNGSCGTDVRVRNNKLHCHNCYSNDEAGLKFSQV